VPVRPSTVHPKPTPEEPEFNWDPEIDLGKSGGFLWTTQRDRIHRQSDGTLKVWITRTPIAEEMEKVRDFFARAGETMDLEQYGYSLWLYQVRCSANQSRFLRTADYSKTKQVLRVHDAIEPWDDAIPESMAEYMIQTVCQNK
jgi:hypothetical protein